MKYWWVCGLFCWAILAVVISPDSVKAQLHGPSTPPAGMAADVGESHDHDAQEHDVHAAKTGPGWSASGLLAGYCILIVGASIFGGWLPSLLSLTHRRMQLCLSLIGGLMLGIAVFHLLPHGIVELSAHKNGLDLAMLGMIVGMVTMFVLLRAFHFHQHEPTETGSEGHHHDHDCGGHHDHGHHDHGPDRHGHSHAHAHGDGRNVSWMGVLMGLVLHTLMDGLALGASVAAEAEHSQGFHLLGLGTFLAILLHKPLDAVSITMLMRSQGWSKAACNGVNLLFSLMCPLGAFLAYLGIQRFAGENGILLGCALAFSAGVFVCIALSDLLPEMEFHSHYRLELSASLLVGIALAWGVKYLEPAHAHDLHRGGEHQHADSHQQGEEEHGHKH